MDNELFKRLLAVEAFVQSTGTTNAAVITQDQWDAAQQNILALQETAAAATNNATAVQAQLNGALETIQDLQGALAAKADKSYVNLQIKQRETATAAKANTTYVDSEIARLEIIRRQRATVPPATDEVAGNPGGDAPATGDGGSDITDGGSDTTNDGSSTPRYTAGQVDPPDCTHFAQNDCGTIKFGTTNVTGFCPMLCNTCSTGGGTEGGDNAADDDDAPAPTSSSASTVAIAVPISIVALVIIIAAAYMWHKNVKGDATPDLGRVTSNPAYDSVQHASGPERCARCKAKTGFCSCNGRPIASTDI